VFETAFTGAESDISSFFLKYSYTLHGHCIASRSTWCTNEKHNTQRTF